MSVYARHGWFVRLALLAGAMVAWPIVRWRQRWRRTAAPLALCYHNVRARDAAAFRRQLAVIADRVVPFDELADAAAAPDGRPAIALTFDDAFAALTRTVIPATAAADVPITIFAIAGVLGMRPTWTIDPDHRDASARTMTADALRRAADVPGVSIGAHTMTHPDLTTRPAAHAIHEINASRDVLEALLRRPVTAFAFPHGRGTAPLVAAARAAGFRTIAGLTEPIAGGAVQRLRMEPDAWPLEFRLTVDGAYGWLPAARRALRALSRRRSAALDVTPDAPLAAPAPSPPATTAIPATPAAERGRRAA